jgi:hypothetical protein
MTDQISAEAQRIYEQSRPDPRMVKMLGEASLSPVQRASLEEIEAHIRTVAEVGEEFGFSLDASKIEFGASIEQVRQIAESKAKAYRRRAGVRALEQKYGHDSAARIVKRHSGRNIR